MTSLPAVLAAMAEDHPGDSVSEQPGRASDRASAFARASAAAEPAPSLRYGSWVWVLTVDSATQESRADLTVGEKVPTPRRTTHTAGLDLLEEVAGAPFARAILKSCSTVATIAGSRPDRLRLDQQRIRTICPRSLSSFPLRPSQSPSDGQSPG